MRTKAINKKKASKSKRAAANRKKSKKPKTKQAEDVETAILTLESATDLINTATSAVDDSVVWLNKVFDEEMAKQKSAEAVDAYLEKTTEPTLTPEELKARDFATEQALRKLLPPGLIPPPKPLTFFAKVKAFFGF